MRSDGRGRHSERNRKEITVAIHTRVVQGACALLVAAALVLPSGSAASQPRPRGSAAWGPVIDLALSRSISRPDVVVDNLGNTTVLWRTLNAIIAIRQNAAGVWGQPTRLGQGTAPKVGVDGSGAVTAIWTRHIPGWGPQVMASRRVLGGRWSRPFPVSAPVASQGSSAHGAFETDLAVSHGGAVLVSWLWGADDSGASRIQARYRPSGHPWHGIANLSPVEARSPVCAVGDHGRAVVIYTQFARVFAVRRTADGWMRRKQIGAHAEPPQVAMDDRGDMTAVWSSLEADGVFRPQAATRRLGHSWTPPHTLDPALDQTLTSSEPVVAIGPLGHSTAAWVRPDGRVLVAAHAIGYPWSRVKEVAAPADPAETVPPYVDITVGADGSRLLSWTREDASSHYIEAAYRRPRQSWQPPHRLSPAQVDASAAEGFVQLGGRAVTAWRGHDNAGAHLQLRKLHP
jgi:hypothetical protein